MIETAWRAGVRRLLFLGSSCIDPKFAEQPIKEAALLSGPLEPTIEWYAIATGYRGEILWDTSKPDGTPRKQLDVSRLAALGWRARIPLDQGLASTVAEFREQLSHQLVRL